MPATILAAFDQRLCFSMRRAGVRGVHNQKGTFPAMTRMGRTDSASDEGT
jgi:hypothetical protein